MVTIFSNDIIDKGLSKGPNVAPRVRPRVKAVEEPRKKAKVDEPLPVVEEIVQEEQQQEPKTIDSTIQMGNIIKVPEMITPLVAAAPTVDECPIIMKDLIKSKFQTGKLSKSEVARRQLKAEKKKSIVKDVIKDEVKVAESVESSPDESLQAHRGPQLRLVNGQMVIDENSLTVATEKEKVDFQRIEEGTARYVSSASFRLRPRTARVKWTPELTELFYDGLSYFGTDFGLTALLFPGFSRNVIKLKFNHEERTNSSKVNEALMNRKVPGEDLKMIMKSNLTLNLEKEEESTQAKNSSTQKKSKTGVQDDKENVQEPEEIAPENVQEAIQESTTIVEKVFQETAQRSFKDAIDNVQSISSSFSKTSQGPKIAPRVSNRPARKPKSDATCD